jgi:hypothetical protein
MELGQIDKWISALIIQGPRIQVVFGAIQTQVLPSEIYQIRSLLTTWGKVSNDLKSDLVPTTPLENRQLLRTFLSIWEAKMVRRPEFLL